MKKKKWYQKISNWLIIVGCIILIPLLMINLYIIFQSQTDQKKVPSVFGIKPFIVLSGSMETQIFTGDLILTKVVNPSTLKVKDIIAFRDANDTVTTHRIIGLVEESGQTYFITKGDNNNTQDENLVKFEDVEGIYVARIPSVGSFMKTLSEPTTIIIMLFGITLIFVIGFGISNKKQREEERKEFLEYKMMKEEEKREKAEKKKKEELMEAINKAVILEQQESTQEEVKKANTKSTTKKVEVKEPTLTEKKRPGRQKKEITKTAKEPKIKTTKKNTTTKTKTSSTSSKAKKKTTTKATSKKSTSTAKKTTTSTKKSDNVKTKRPVGRPKKSTASTSKTSTKSKKTKE